MFTKESIAVIYVVMEAFRKVNVVLDYNRKLNSPAFQESSKDLEQTTEKLNCFGKYFYI